MAGAYYNGFGLVLPGVSGNYASTPDAAALDIVGDLDLRGELTLSNWATPPVGGRIVAKNSVTTPHRAYELSIDTAGVLALSWFPDGITAVSVTTLGVTTGFANGSRGWVRGTLDVDDGGSRTVRLWKSTDGTAWTQMSVSTVAGVTSIASGNAVLEVGSRFSGTSSLIAGTIHRVQVRSGIDGTIVADPRFDQQPLGSLATFADSAGRVWSINTTDPIPPGGGAGQRYRRMGVSRSYRVRR